MRGVFWLLSALSVIGHCGAQDAPLDCVRLTCVEGVADELLSLDCGGSGEAITGFLFASFGQPQGSCPDANDHLFNDSALDLKKTTGCHMAATESKLLAACKGKERCEVKLDASFVSDVAGLDGCDALKGNRIVVHASCGPQTDPLQIVLALVIATIGLGLGASIELGQFRMVLTKHKRAVIIGWCCQYGIMPLTSFVLVKTFGLSPEVGVGVVLVGSAPGGTTSNLFTYWAKGSVALSVTMSAASTSMALFALPLLIQVYIKGALEFDESIEIPFGDILSTLAIAVLPCSLGVVIRSRSKTAATKVEKVGVTIGGIFIAVALVIGVKKSPELLRIDKLPRVWSAAMLLQPIGGALGYAVASIARMPRPERRAVCLETGIQSTTLIVALVALTFTGCERLEILTFPLLSSVTLIINSVWMTLLLRYTSKWDTEQDRKALEADQMELDATKIHP